MGWFEMSVVPMWLRFVIVGVAGGIGAICRYLILVHMRILGDLQGLGTLVVNSIACFIIGIFAGWMVVAPWSDAQKTVFTLLTMTGFCGGFSTFSAFTLDCVRYYEAGQIFVWIIFGTLTVFVGLFGCAVGYWIGQKF